MGWKVEGICVVRERGGKHVVDIPIVMTDD